MGGDRRGREPAADRRRARQRWCGRSPRASTRTRTGRCAGTRAARSTGGCAPGARAGWTGCGPSPRSDTGKVRAMPELFAEAAALRLELPGRSAAQIASILYHRHGVRVAERTVRGQLRRAGLHRAALKAAPKAYGRYEAARPNERWVTDVLVGPWVPYPRRDGSARARLFLIVDDHSRLLVDGRFYAGRTPAPARTCCAGRSPEAASRRSYTRITGRLSPTRGWRGHARCSASGWCTAALLAPLNRPISSSARGSSGDRPAWRCYGDLLGCRPACRVDRVGSDRVTRVP